MLRTRIDQENALHARQVAGAAKTNALAPKTPGNRPPPKTPGKILLNDENEVEKAGGKGLGGKSFGGKAEKNLFQTPAPRERQALGFKTTNAKATAFQTPAPKALGPSPTKTQKRSVVRQKLQVHKEEPKVAEPEIDWANEEIQYIPPRPKDLEDIPSDDEWDKIDFSILRTGNFEAGRIREKYRRIQEKDDKDWAEQEKEEREAFEKDYEKLMKNVVTLLADPEYEDDDEVPAKKPTPAKTDSRQIDTLASRMAATSLSQPKKIPSFMAPTTATKAKEPTKSHNRSVSVSSGPSARGSSYQTLGYAKGRAVSHTVRPSVSTAAKEEPKQSTPKRRDPLKELEELIMQREFEEAGITGDDLDDDLAGGVGLDDDEEEEIFQFKIPEA